MKPRRANALFLLVAATLLAGCRVNAAVSNPGRVNEFAIYLLAETITPNDLSLLSHLDLQPVPLITIREIVSYTKDTHEIELTMAGYEIIRELSVPTSGRAFAICVDGQPVYGGAFWPGYSSQSFDGVVIDPIFITREHPVLRIQLGYPGSSFYTGQDPRSDPVILRSLSNDGKLR